MTYCIDRMRIGLALLTLAVAAAKGVNGQDLWGANLIVNGGAEAGPGVGGNSDVSSVPGWTNNGATVLTYASGYGLDAYSLLPKDVGQNYFSIGGASSSLTQTINLSSGADAIDARAITFDASGYFGGYSSRDDYATLTIVFADSNGASLFTVTIGKVQAADRYKTGLYLRRQIGLVPPGTRSAKLTLSFVKMSSGDNNGYADNLSLQLNTAATLPQVFGANVIVNGDAEAAIQQPDNEDFSNDIPQWVRTANFTADSYGGSNADLDATSARPADAGKRYFYGGPANEFSSAYQDIDLSNGSDRLDSGLVTFDLSGWIGGYATQDDYLIVTLEYYNWSGTLLSSTSLPAVFAAERGGVSGMVFKSTSGTVPAGTRMARVRLDATRMAGAYNDGLADSLVLILTPPPPSTAAKAQTAKRNQFELLWQPAHRSLKPRSAPSPR